MPTIGPRWDTLNCDDAAADALAAALKISPVVARLLCQRGLSDPELADRFLNPSLDHLHDPMLLADMGVAVDRIMAAIARKEQIAIHGDYDVDGITSTVILRRALELLGADVDPLHPRAAARTATACSRSAIERLHADGVALVISVDCGIRGAEAARRARELGVDLIITDHHEPDTELPPALAVINPKRHDCTLSRQVPRRRRRRAEAGAGALPPRRPREAGCRDSSRSPRSARSPTSCRSSARTASSPSSGSSC